MQQGNRYIYIIKTFVIKLNDKCKTIFKQVFLRARLNMQNLFRCKKDYLLLRHQYIPVIHFPGNKNYIEYYHLTDLNLKKTNIFKFYSYKAKCIQDCILLFVYFLFMFSSYKYIKLNLNIFLHITDFSTHFTIFLSFSPFFIFLKFLISFLFTKLN